MCMYIEYGLKHNKKNPKFKVGDPPIYCAMGICYQGSQMLKIGIFYEIEMQKTNETEFRIENVIKENDIKHFTSNGMAMITHSIAELI